MQSRLTVDHIAIFLESTLAGGAVSVATLEERARAAGLLGENEHTGDTKKFRAAKKRIASRREGFGRDGRWLWERPVQIRAAAAETALDQPSTVPKVVDQRVSTEPPRSDPSDVPNDGVPRHRIPLDWVRGIAALRRQTRPSGIPDHRWKLFVADCVRFIDPQYPWAQRAAEVGWSTGSLFGSRYQRPLDHIGSSGLLWDMAGGTIAQLSRDTATIVSENGKQRIYHRRPAWMTTLLPWSGTLS